MKKSNYLIVKACFLGCLLAICANRASAQSYCEPSYTVGCTISDNYISNLTLNGENGTAINNNSECSTGPLGFGGGYGNYSSLPPVVLIPGQTYNGSISSDGYTPPLNKVRIWIDWDNDGTFDVNDIIAEIDGMDLLTNTNYFSFTVPNNASSGNHRLRARLISGVSIGSVDPCNSQEVGEAEDYTVVVCIPPTVDGIIATGNLNGSYTFESDNAQEATSYHWDFGDGNTTTGSTVEHVFEGSGTYTVTLTVENDCGESTITTIIEHTESSSNLDVNYFVSTEIFPNPASKQIQINFNDDTNVKSVKVINTSGKAIFDSQTNGESTLIIPTINFISGFYIVELNFDNGSIYRQKLIIK